LLCIARYARLTDDNVEMHLVEDGPSVVWQLRNAVPPALRLTNDFQVTAAFMNLSRRLGLRKPLIEVHFRHTEPDRRRGVRARISRRHVSACRTTA